jgi:hypothetical protein
MVPVVGLDGFQAGLHHCDDLVVTMANKGCQRGPDGFLIVRNQYAHA